MNEDRLCSIITVSYNSSATIERTILSVLNQTYTNIEYIIVDGASTDRTVDIIKKYEPDFKGRLKWVSEPDEGIYFAMNKGINMATGDIVGIINSDDFYEPEAVRDVMDAFGNKKGCYILYGMLRTLRDGIEDNINICSPAFIRNRSMAHPACFVSKQLYDTYGGYNTEFVSAADYDFFLRMANESGVLFEPIYSVLANFSIGGMSATSKAYWDLLKVQKTHGIITASEYKKLIMKSKIHDFLTGNR